MLTNFHTHTNLCDGDNTPEEMVKSAINNGFLSLGFSGHAYTDFDLSYCMKDTDAYIKEINRLKEKYKNKIQIYLGLEEDAGYLHDRNKFDYIIGSSHYLTHNGNFYAYDVSYDGFKEICKLFDNDYIKTAENYYERFCNYIITRKPDIIGHFDCITKYDELDEPVFRNNEKYRKMVENYLNVAIKSECIFEVNTGAISRKYRTNPYPDEHLLYILKKNNSKLILSSDSHAADTLDFYFEETRKILKDIGFEYVYALYNNEFIKDYL